LPYQVDQFRNGLDSFAMELKGLDDATRKVYKRKFKAHKKALTEVKNKLEWKTTKTTRDALLGDHVATLVDVGPDLDTERGLMGYGKNMLDEDDEALKRTLTKVHETVELGAATATKLQEQTNQVGVVCLFIRLSVCFTNVSCYVVTVLPTFISQYNAFVSSFSI
jgi:hypothetical protein